MNDFLLYFTYLIALLYLVASFKLNDSDDGLRTSGSRRSSSRKRVSGCNQLKSKDSTDSVCLNDNLSLLFLFFVFNRTLTVLHHLQFYVKQHRMLFLTNLIIIPHQIMINKVWRNWRWFPSISSVCFRSKFRENRFEQCQRYDWYWWTIKIVRKVHERKFAKLNLSVQSL